MESLQKYGVLRSWYPERGFGVVDVTRSERYLLHITRILDDNSMPWVGCGVYFTPASPFKAGALPLAVDAKIVDPQNGGAR
jgi:hypothetical protein